MSRALIVAVFLSIALPACGGGPSNSDCEKLLDHMIDLEVTAAGAEGNDKLDKQRAEFRDSVKDEFMSQCTEQTPKSFVECALKKKSRDELAKCDG